MFFPINRFKSIDYKTKDWELYALQSSVRFIREEAVVWKDFEIKSKELYFNSKGYLEKQIFKDQFKIVYHYNDSYLFPKLVEVYFLNTLKIKLKFSYNSLKNELIVDNYNYHDIIEKQSSYLYNSQNLLIEEKHISKKEEFSIKYNFDNQFRIIEEEHYVFDNLECLFMFQYFESGKFIKENYNWEQKLVSIEEHYHNKKTNSKIITIYNTKKVLLHNYSFEYDCYTNLVKKRKVENAFIQETITNRYDYDTLNNWVERNKIHKGEITSTTKRRINYF